MNKSLVQLDDLPDEILIHIFKKLYNNEVLYSFIDVNQRLNRIVHDPIFTRSLYLCKCFPYDNSIDPLPDPILDRFCSKILPEIGHQVTTLFLEATSMERILHATNYSNLNNLGLYDIDEKVATSLFFDENPLIHTFKDQISSLFIKFNNNEKNSSPREMFYTFLFEKILTIFTNLRCLKFDSSSDFAADVWMGIVTPIVVSTLLELHVNLPTIHEFLRVLDGRFDQLRILYVNVNCISSENLDIDKYKLELLPNLRIFSLYCMKVIYDFYESVVPLLLHRMINLEELDLNVAVKSYEKLIDVYILIKDISCMPRLYQFTFNIYAIIKHEYQTDLQSNEYFYNKQMITCIDHFQEERYSQYHIYSYPYKWKVYYNITNNFPGGLFNCVIYVSLYDKRPFEHEFFLRIAQSFPFMKELTVMNEKGQNDKQLIKSNNHNQALSIIKYPNLTRLDLTRSHDDYIEQFLLDTKMSLPNNLHFYVEYQSLERVTYNFTRYTTRNNSAKLAALYLYSIYSLEQVDQHIKDYFPHTDVCHDYCVNHIDKMYFP